MSEARGMKLEKWLDAVGISRSTAYAWMNQGMLRPTNILGLFYITREQDEEFWARAAAGEFTVNTKRKEA